MPLDTFPMKSIAVSGQNPTLTDQIWASCVRPAKRKKSPYTLYSLACEEVAPKPLKRFLTGGGPRVDWRWREVEDGYNPVPTEELRLIP